MGTGGNPNGGFSWDMEPPVHKRIERQVHKRITVLISLLPSQVLWSEDHMGWTIEIAQNGPLQYHKSLPSKWLGPPSPQNGPHKPGYARPSQVFNRSQFRPHESLEPCTQNIYHNIPT